MFDIGWTEIAVIVVVAIVVIGPKDLPLVLRTAGSWIRKARMLTREFQGHIDEMIREAELEDVRRQALELKNANLAKQVEKTIDPTGSLRHALDPNADKVAPAKEAGAAPAAIASASEAAPAATVGAEAGAIEESVPQPEPPPAPSNAEPARTAEPAPSYTSTSEQAEPEKRA